jgi:hypothetical protein
MSGAAGRYTILESWPMIREDFEAFTKDPTQWFADQFEQAARKKDWESIFSSWSTARRKRTTAIKATPGLQ